MLYSVGGVTRTLISNAKSISFDLNKGKTIFDKNYFDSSSGKLAVWSNVVNPETKKYIQPDDVKKWDLWKTVYYTPFAVLPAKDKMISILHGENKNNLLGGKVKYTNTVKAPETVYYDNDFSTNNSENWENYFAFVTSAVANQDTLLKDGNLLSQDNGPIIWPDNGYLDDLEEKVSCGLRHPSAIVHDDYLYVFYIEHQQSNNTSSIKVARSPLSANAAPGSFKKYYNGSFSENALPENFDKDDRSFVYKASGMSSTIIESRNPIKFTAAKLTGTPYFIGVMEETGQGGIHYISISVSKYLVNWTIPMMIEETMSENWNNGNLHYPIIYNRDFSSNMEVSPDGFFIVGTSGSYGGWWLPQYLPLTIEVIEEKGKKIHKYGVWK